MNNWNIEKIGKFATIGRGSSPRPITDKRYFEKGTIPWIKIADATAAGRVIYKTKEYVNEYGASFSRLLKKGSLILSASGVSLGIPRFLGVDGCIHDGWLYLEDIHGIDVNFLYYKLLTLRQYFDNLSYGAAIQNINTDIFSNTKIQLPPLPKQQKIASILSAYDNLIQNYKKQIEDLQTTASELYKEWFVRFRFPGYKTAQFENGIPVGWKIARVGEYAKVKSGFAFKSEWWQDEGCPVVKINDIDNGEVDINNFDYVSEEHTAKAKSFLLNEGDLVIAMTGATIGKVGIVPKVNNLYTNQRVGKFFLGNEPFKKMPFLYCLFTQNSTIETVYCLSGASSAQPNISPEQIESIKFFCNEKLINSFITKAEPIFRKISELRKQITNLTQQRDLLLPRLMSGKLEV